jgi:hypothetical protein
LDPISVSLLLAVAMGAGESVGSQVWDGLRAIVRRPFRRRGEAGHDERSGSADLAVLARVPDDAEAAAGLSAALAARAAEDASFRAALEEWLERARGVYSESGMTHNEISGGTFHQPVIQGRDGISVSFGTPPPSGPTSRK